MTDRGISIRCPVTDKDLSYAGEVSSKVKKLLTELGVAPGLAKKAILSLYEAEINAIIHASGGLVDVVIDSKKVSITVSDQGPGIPNIELAMQEGFSTASDKVRQMGFGAGMGLPNIKKHADELEILSEVGEGTTLKITVYW